jgi:parallel beta-helix repeat protein
MFCDILNNNISLGNNYGIYFINSHNINMINNTVMSNIGYGFYLFISSNNKIFHNNIINNGNQAFDDSNTNLWDNSYPSGGNYWSNYGGIDNYKGPLQDIPGTDGIGDTNYTIDSDSKDYFPLMVPYPGSWLKLEYGWNLISLPKIQLNTSVYSVLASLIGEYDAVQFYNITDGNDHWKHYHISKPSQLNDLIGINHNQGFWIHITNPSGTIFRYDGSNLTFNQTINLQPGWNMVGYPSRSNKNLTEGLNNLTYGSDVDAIWTYNATTQTWEEITESDNFEVGRGYWVHSKVTKTWIVPL